MEGRAVLVTGASRGIGRAVARAFAEQGDRVAVHFRYSAGRAAQGLASLPGPGTSPCRPTWPTRRRCADGGLGGQALGGLDVLVNNAGIYTPHPITEVSYEAWQAAWREPLGVNLVGAANVTWCAVKHMIPSGGGRIVNVSSRGASAASRASPRTGPARPA